MSILVLLLRVRSLVVSGAGCGVATKPQYCIERVETKSSFWLKVLFEGKSSSFVYRTPKRCSCLLPKGSALELLL